MKVVLCVRRYENVEIEIDDKFKKLSDPDLWLGNGLEEEDFDECIDAIKKATGLSFHNEYDEATIITATDPENDMTMIEF